MNIMFVTFTEWSIEKFSKSLHPEYVAIRNIILRHPRHRYVLIGLWGAKYESLRLKPDVTFYNLPCENLLKGPVSTILLLFLLLVLKPSVMVGLGLFPQLPLGIASTFTRSRFIAVLFGELFYVGSKRRSLFGKYAGLITKIVIIFLRAALKNASTLMAISEKVKRDITKACAIPSTNVICYRYRISEIFHPAVNAELRHRWNLAGPIVLTSCRIEPRKGLHHLIRSAKIVSARIPNVKFIIRGPMCDPKYLKYLYELITHFDLHHYVTIIPHVVSYSEIPNLLNAADVFVHPSIDEGLGIAIMEALASGLPVIATRVGGIPDIVMEGENGILVEPYDVRSLADAIIKVLKNEDLKKRLSEGALKRSKEFRDSKENEYQYLLEMAIFEEEQKHSVSKNLTGVEPPESKR